jgi:hypothetical protein
MITDYYDNRIILFGGGIPWSLFDNDLWALNCATEGWKPIFPTGTLPATRFMASTVYYSPYDSGNAMILIGGRTDAVYFDEVWLLDLTPGYESWHQVTVSGTHPPLRSSATCILDQTNNRIILFGGEGSGGSYNDVWALNLATWAWSSLSPSGTPPSVRYEHTAIYDPVGQRMIVFGGKSGSTYNNEVWSLSLSSGNETWACLSPSGTPPDPRGRQFTAYDPVRNSMVMGFGYMYAGGFSFFNDAWVLHMNPLQWIRILTNGPEGRRGSCAAYNPLNHQTVIFGGDGNDIYVDTYSLLSDTVGVEEIKAIGERTGRCLLVDGNPGQMPCSIIVTVPQKCAARLKIYDPSGRSVKTIFEGILAPDSKRIFSWNGRDENNQKAAAGTYFIRLETGGQKYNEKIIVVR